jgi:hypothetical protein
VGGWNEVGTLAMSEAYVPPGCVPATCAARGSACGAVPDGCGRMLDCGPCGASQGCGLEGCRGFETTAAE